MIDIGSQLNTDISLLAWSNGLYIAGCVLTLCAGAYILYQKREVKAGHRAETSIVSEAGVLIFAVLTLFGTIGGVRFSNLVSHLKDVELAAYEAQANTSIAKNVQATSEANADAKDAEARNSELRREVARQEAANLREHRTLQAETQKVGEFTQTLAQKEQVLATRMQAPASMSDAEADTIGTELAQYSGAAVAIHTMIDPPSQRLAAEINRAFEKAKFKIGRYSTDVGPDYNGVVLGVHSADGHPKVADAILKAFRGAGLNVQPVADASAVPSGVVAVFIGPPRN